MNPKDPVIALVDRTLANLAALESASEAADEPTLFEVTQLVNSLLSLLVIPKELKTTDFIEQGKGAHVRLTGIPDWQRGSIKFELRALNAKPPQRLDKLLVGLRNSVAHATFEFLPDAKGEIIALDFTACGPSGNEFWAVTFPVEELRRFLFALGAELRDARVRQAGAARPLLTRDVPKRTLKISLTTSVLDRIAIIVENQGAETADQFIQDAVEAALAETVDMAAA